MTALLFALFFGLLAIGLPVAFAIGVSASIVVFTAERIPPTFIVSTIFSGLDSFPLMAVPFYIFAGNLMTASGLTMRIVALANALVGHVRGGLAQVSILSGAMFGAVSGSATADTAAVGSIMIPAMRKQGYAPDFAVSIVAAAGTMAPIIPPSILFIVYGSLVQVSIGQLFLAGFLPGLLMAVVMMMIATLMARRRGYATAHDGFEVGRLVRAFGQAIWALFIPLIIIGGIVGGFFTPTEAGVVAVFYALAVSMLLLRTVRPSHLPAIVLRSAVMTCIVMLILGPATVFGSLLIRDHFPRLVMELLNGATSDPTVSIFLIVGFIMVLGLVMDVMVIIIMFAYPFSQVANQYGFDPVHFGLIFVLSAVVGGITPPVGSLLFVSCSIGRVSLLEGSRTIWPFVVGLLALLVMLILMPGLTTIVPYLVV